MDIVMTLLTVGITANALGFAVLILAGPVYAWNDRWLDRSHRATADEDRE